MFLWLVLKIGNFADIRRNSNVFMQKKKLAFLKIISLKNSRILAIFDELVVYLRKKNCAFKINQPEKLISNFSDFWQKNNIFMKNDQYFKECQLKKKKVYNSIISLENCKFCLLFIEIIVYNTHKQKKNEEKVHLKIINWQKSSYFQNYSWKIVNFVNSRQNNCVFMQKITNLKHNSSGKS